MSLQTDINQVFTARLGFIGIDTGPFGRVAIGKQYAVHYDVAGYTTDRFNVFGGQGTFAYPAGTDGGVYGYRPCRPRGAVPKHFSEDPRSRSSGAVSGGMTPMGSAVRSSSKSCRE